MRDHAWRPEHRAPRGEQSESECSVFPRVPRLSAAGCNRFTCPDPPQLPFPIPNGAQEVLSSAPAPRHGGEEVLSPRRRGRRRQQQQRRVSVEQLVLPASAGGTFLDVLLLFDVMPPYEVLALNVDLFLFNFIVYYDDTDGFLPVQARFASYIPYIFFPFCYFQCGYALFFYEDVLLS